MWLIRALVDVRRKAALGLALVAPVALAADPGQCETRCATAPSTEMQSCLQRCPEAREPSKARSFQACALRCKDRFDSAFKACQERCPGHERAQDKKKKSSQP